MQRSVPWFWILLALLLLAPGGFGRALLDVLGGLTLVALLAPLLLAGAGLVAWQILRRRMRTCEVCGFSAVGLESCPSCGAAYAAAPSGDRPLKTPRDLEVDASQVTIDVEVIPEEDRL